MYIDENCFLPLKMEELFTIAVSLGEIVHKEGKRRNLENPRCYESTREEFGRLYNSERDDSLQEL